MKKLATATAVTTLAAMTLMAAGTSQAGNYGPYSAPAYGHHHSPQQRQQHILQHHEQNDPAIKVKAQLAGLRAFLSEAQGGAIPPQKALAYVEQQIAPDIDFATMTRMSLGRLANRISPAQRAEAESTLRKNFATKIVEAMGDIRGTRVTIGATRPGQSRGELVVPVRLERWRGQPLSLNFRFYQSKDGWKVFDAVANGQSAVLFYRGWFARQWRGG